MGLSSKRRIKQSSVPSAISNTVWYQAHSFHFSGLRFGNFHCLPNFFPDEGCILIRERLIFKNVSNIGGTDASTAP